MSCCLIAGKENARIEANDTTSSMKTYLSISFRTGLSLEELAERIGLDPVEFDAENEAEWALGALGDFNDIDIARTHLVPPNETRTSVFRYTSGPDRGMPVELLRSIDKSLRDAATEFEVQGTESTGQWFKLDAEEVERLTL
jgi:hypothetical protein